MVRVFAAIVLVAAQFMASVTSEFVEFNYDLARSYAGDGVSFLSTDLSSVPEHLLMGLDSQAQQAPPPNPPANPANPPANPPGQDSCPQATDDEKKNGIKILYDPTCKQEDTDCVGNKLCRKCMLTSTAQSMNFKPCSSIDPSTGSTTPSTVACKVTTEEQVSGKVTVLIAISRCLSDAAVTTIKNWAVNLQASQKTFFQDNTATAIEFAVASVPGSCQALTEANAHGQVNAPGQSLLMATDERLASFSDFARVLAPSPPGSPTQTSEGPSGTTTYQDKTTKPVAVVSFVDNDSSFDLVQQYELTSRIKTVFNFKICESGKNCGGNFENCIVLNDPVDVFMYSPFKVATKLNCANLPGAIPVMYTDATNQRQCACACPAGSKLSSDNKQCDVVNEKACQCVWANAYGAGYRKEIGTWNAGKECLFTNLATTFKIPAPVPIDNYVGKGRDNLNDAKPQLATNGPHITVRSTRIEDPVYRDSNTGLRVPVGPAFTPISNTYTWRDYQEHRNDKIDAIKYTAFGKYKIEVDAYDYNSTKSTDCPGCVAFVDKFRPVHTTACPSIFCDNSTSDCSLTEGVAELTKLNVEKVKTQLTQYYKYQSEALNDNCASNTPEKRCDIETIETKKFGAAGYGNADGYAYKTGGSSFTTNLKTDLTNLGKLSNVDVETAGDPATTSYGKCTRCISLSTTLREYWTDFKCDSAYDIEKCEGNNGETCELQQCLIAFGDTLAVANANIKAAVKEESKQVINQLVEKSYNTETQVHVALQCTKFVDNVNNINEPDEQCIYTASMADLIDVSTTANSLSILSDTEAKNFVTWRYRVDTGGSAFKDWTTTSTSPVQFKKAQTKIEVEAWTKCGIVRKYYFYVNLHLNNVIDVCTNFRSMWYQTTNTKLTAPNDFCMYPKSDFAEITFDYHANIGLNFSTDKLSMNIQQVECRLSYAGASDTKIVDVTGDSREIVSRFAVLAQRKPTTLPLTNFHVTCDFFYKRYKNQAVAKQTCNQDFFITDCSVPEIDKPCPLNDVTCAPDTCLIGENKARSAPYEACGGNIVYLDGKTTLFKNASTATDTPCCQFCAEKYTTSCAPLLSLPTTNEIKRCEPVVKTPSLVLAGMEKLQSTTESTAGATTVLLSASAMVALVALAVVQRRRAGATPANGDVMEDAYYPLLN